MKFNQVRNTPQPSVPSLEKERENCFLDYMLFLNMLLLSAGHRGQQLLETLIIILAVYNLFPTFAATKAYDV